MLPMLFPTLPPMKPKPSLQLYIRRDNRGFRNRRRRKRLRACARWCVHVLALAAVFTVIIYLLNK